MGFKNSGIDFEQVDEAGSSKMLPAGGYVATIIKVEDVEKSEYLRFVYDIAEGPQKHFFADDDREYTHQFTRSYKTKALPFMKKFLKCIEDSGSGFVIADWDNDPDALIGRTVGIIVQREDYTNQSGEDRARMNVEGFASAHDIRAGRFVVPEPKDNREKKPESVQATADEMYDADIPF